MVYAPLPVETNPDAVIDRMLARLVDALPGYVAREGALEVALVEEIGRELAATNARAADAAAAAIAGIGITIDGLAPITGIAAVLPVTLTLVEAGTIPAGFTVAAIAADGTDVAYRTLADVIASSIGVQATMTATQVGTSANGDPGELTVVTATALVLTATATGPGAGGVDPETRDEYLDRLINFRSLLRPGGVRASDLALLARNTPGVERALGVDLYDASTGQTSAKTVSLYPIDEAGAPVTGAARDALKASIEAVREVGLLVQIASPTYTPLDIMITVGADESADPQIVEQAVRASVAAYLDPATWGAPREDPRAWLPTPIVRYTEIIRAAGSADGVLYVDDVTINADTIDVTLPGVAALPAPTTGLDPTVITVVVTT